MVSDPESAAAGYCLLVNPSAGKGRALKRLPAIRAELDRREMRHSLVMTSGIEQGCEAALEASRRGEVPVVVSGDGLIGKVGGALAGTGTALGVIPGGRGNDLARVVGIPTEPEAAVAVLAAGNRRSIDVGETNGERFLCIASCGFDSDANRIANETTIVSGALVYAYAAIKALWQWRPAEFEVTVDGVARKIRGYSVAVANSKAYGGGMFVAPDARLDDGQLDVVITGDVSKLRFLTGLPQVFKGTHVERDDVTTLRGGVVEVTADRPFDVYADGDALTSLPMRVSVLAGALELIAPPAGAA
ncbi:MAG TPA: YegS/Rv2252/BmrU family lipid kinase [Solirubrobacterales bacterium]|nr:YegS/Rv2252/BmrU family lipid kinase [Solirubrobacterales bacterium]